MASQKQIDAWNKTAEHVAADFLRMIWDYTKADIRRVTGDDWESVYALKIVLTIPAIWTAAASERTKRATNLAGIPGIISLVTEPEAAALVVLKDQNELNVILKAGDAFVVCDAGGGTVVSVENAQETAQKLTEFKGPNQLQSPGGRSSADIRVCCR